MMATDGRDRSRGVRRITKPDDTGQKPAPPSVHDPRKLQLGTLVARARTGYAWVALSDVPPDELLECLVFSPPLPDDLGKQVWVFRHASGVGIVIGTHDPRARPCTYGVDASDDD